MGVKNASGGEPRSRAEGEELCGSEEELNCGVEGKLQIKHLENILHCSFSQLSLRPPVVTSSVAFI